MNRRNTWLGFMWVGVVLALTYALFAPVWFISFPLGVLVAMGFVGGMFAPVGKGGAPSQAAYRHNPQAWKKRG